MASGNSSHSSQEGDHNFDCCTSDRPCVSVSCDNSKNSESVNQFIKPLDFYNENYEPINSDSRRFQTRLRHQLEKQVSRQEKENGAHQTVCNFHEQYTDLKKKYDSNRMELDKKLTETELCKKMCADLSHDRESMALEKDELKQRLAKALQQLEASIHEKNLLLCDRDKIVQQREMEVQEMTQLLNERTMEIQRVTAQRNTAKKDLQTTLGERNGVLEENQKLSDDLAAAKTELEKIFKNDQSLIYENDALKRNRDELISEVNCLRERIKEKELLSCDSAREDTKEMYEMELKKAKNEVEVAKTWRDLAISEREKIVQERDGVKVRNDELQKQRDKAVSDLLQAIRSNEEIKKQKDEAISEIEHLRKQLESQARRSIRWNHVPYDVETLPKYATEMIEINMSAMGPNDDIGIELESGREDSQNRHDSGLAVTNVTQDSPAYGKLRPNDTILFINKIDCGSFSRRMAIDSIRNAGKSCSLIVKRQQTTRAHMYAAQLNMTKNRNHGLSLESGIFVSKVFPNTLASIEANLSVGDRILSINNMSMEGVTCGKDATSYLEDDRAEIVNIIALKQVTQPTDADTFIRNKPNRMINTCTQTDERNNYESEISRNNPSGNAKSTSKISEMFNKFRGKIHMNGHTQKGSTTSDGDSLYQENDAIAALDSVLNIENSSSSSVKIKENLFKRSKKAKKESTKEINKNLGTWPRANIFNATVVGQDNHTGTIVQHRKKERPALSLFTGPISLGKDEKSSVSKRDSYFGVHNYSTPPPMSSSKPSSSLTGSNRTSNTNPLQVLYQPSTLNRHSVYSALESEPVLLDGDNKSKELTYLNRKHHHHYYNNYHHQNNNRLSLNITPSSDSNALYNTLMNRKNFPSMVDTKPNPSMSMDYTVLKSSNDSLLNSKVSSLDFKHSLHHQQHQQQDLISLKSQNSIDSFLSPKNASLSLDPSKQLFTSENSDFYQKRMSKNVSKYPSDSDSLGMESISSPNSSYTSTLPSYVTNNRAQTMLATSGRMHKIATPLMNPHMHLHSNRLRQTSPLTIPVTQSIDLGGANNNSSDKIDFDFGQSLHSHAITMDIDPYHRKVHPMRDRDVAYGGYGQMFEGGTFPRKKDNQRVRIPSNPSVASRSSDMKDSSGSIEHSEPGQSIQMALPPFKVEVLGADNPLSDHNPIRRITINKSVARNLGITIRCNDGGGIFVSSVQENSIASRAGLRSGDQLLEVCGINMRDANHKIAAKILQQCGNPMTMLAQYCPDKFHGSTAQHTTEDESVSHSGSPTPRNSPRGIDHRSRDFSSYPVSMQSESHQQSPPQLIPKRSLISSNIKKQKFSDSLENQSDCSQTGSPDLYDEEEPRVLTLNTRKNTNLGISLMGGNAVGIYVHDVQKGSLADASGMKKGDQILEYSGVDLRNVTAECAATEISKPSDKVIVVVQHNIKKFNQIKDEAGDSLYIRAGFDRTGDLNDGELRFAKDDILYVDTTIFRGKFGQWRAWKLDENGHRLKWGIIPSQLKVEEELRILTDTADGDGTTKRKSARRSFFRRKKHHRSSSRDSKDLSTFSSTQLSWFTDSLGEDGTLAGYQRVERLEYVMCRPVLILGPLSDCVAEKLTIDFPQLFERLLPTKMNCSQENMEDGLQKNILVDYRRRGSVYECTPAQAVQDLCDKNRHGLLDVSISAVERLKRIQIYPIVLMLRFKSARQIKEIRDEMSEKAAKEMYEHALKLESDCRQYISAVILAGVNITHICTQIKSAVDEEQNKVIWVPVTNP